MGRAKKNVKMEHNIGGQVSASSSNWNHNTDDDDDDEAFTEQDLDVIDAAFRSASKSRRADDDGALRRLRRRLPSSVLALQHPTSFSLSPCQENAKMRYPVFKFGGKITYSRTRIQVERAATELLETVKAKRRESGQVAIGFDIEWKASFRKGVKAGKVATMQMCADANHCHVMHIFHSGIPKRLQSLLENSMLLKVGIGIGNDTVKVFKDHNISIGAVEELGYLANQKLAGESRNWSLASLTENLVSKQLLKPKKIQLGNWETEILSKDQLEYAATDAFASWHLYEVLRSLPDLEKIASDSSEEVKDVSPSPQAPLPLAPE